MGHTPEFQGLYLERRGQFYILKPATVGRWDLALTLAVQDSSVHSSKTEESSLHSSQPCSMCHCWTHLQPGTVKRSLQFTQAKRLTCEMLLPQGPAVGTSSGLCSLITQLPIPSVLAQSSCLTTGPEFGPELSTHTSLPPDPVKEVTTARMDPSFLQHPQY